MTNGETTWNFTYDANGMRTSRTDGTTTYNYVYNGGSLVQMTVGSNTLYFTSDTVTFNGVTYYYVKNLQGDVTGIVDGSGATVATYVYDAWGNLISDEPAENTIGHLNPIRYRGYVYDSESELYYVSSRYYDPEIGRFINADALVSTGQGILGNNMFAYCRNNPVIRYDVRGYCDSKFKEKNDDEVETAQDPIAEGGGGGGGTSTVGTAPSGGSNGAGVQGSVQSSAKASTSGSYLVVSGSPTGEKTEVHHIVERCQSGKSGFSMVDIEGTYNKIQIPRNVHHKISGYYSSKPADLDGLRVRDWLAGQSFDVQQAYGWRIIEQMWVEVYG